MKRISAYIINLLFVSAALPLTAQAQAEKPDSVDIPLKVRSGFEITGPFIYLADRSLLNLEASVSVDMNEVRSVYLGAGYSDYNYSQYNYSFAAKGPFLKAGVDFNLLKPELAEGRYWAGLGIRYGLSRFSFETSAFRHDNYWGSVSSSVPLSTNWSHFIEAAGGFRAELTENIGIGWVISVRKLIYSGAGSDLKPVYIPGYGESGKSFSFGINYFISWNMTFKKIRVKIKEEPVEESDDDEETDDDFSRNVGRQRIGM